MGFENICIISWLMHVSCAESIACIEFVKKALREQFAMNPIDINISIERLVTNPNDIEKALELFKNHIRNNAPLVEPISKPDKKKSKYIQFYKGFHKLKKWEK